MTWDDENPYDPHREGPEARLNRKAAEEQRERDAAFYALVDSLTPADARRVLIPYRTVREWQLKRHRRG